MPDEMERLLTQHVQDLVRIDSRGDRGEFGDIIDAVHAWLHAQGIDVEVLRDGTRPVAV